MNDRFTFIDVPGSRPQQKLCAVTEAGLLKPHKVLPSRFFYDAAGSALFEQICALPEYYPTRTEHAILASNAREMIDSAGKNLALVEFGSGSSSKTRLLIEALLDRQPALHYLPIDISADFLRQSCYALLDDYERLTITGIAAEYSDGIRALPAPDSPRLFLFLGSNIGNFDRDEAEAFLQRIRQQMKPEDRVLVGIDLIKERSILTAAYNDSTGVTAAFNKNLLVRINNELGGKFALDAFEHEAPYVESESRIEMHLVSCRKQSVPIAYLEQSFNFQKDERIHTENSHKYTLDSFSELCTPACLKTEAYWMDERNWFAVLLLKPIDAAGNIRTKISTAGSNDFAQAEE